MAKESRSAKEASGPAVAGGGTESRGAKGQNSVIPNEFTEKVHEVFDRAREKVRDVARSIERKIEKSI